MCSICSIDAAIALLMPSSVLFQSVAATGLPNPQIDHAARMTRFASDCMQKMNILTAELSLKLGPETSTLKLRVGLHSGKVTGGVLKGDKSRFQLFGDAMNTARYVLVGRKNKLVWSCTWNDTLISIACNLLQSHGEQRCTRPYPRLPSHC